MIKIYRLLSDNSRPRNTCVLHLSAKDYVKKSTTIKILKKSKYGKSTIKTIHLLRRIRARGLLNQYLLEVFPEDNPLAEHFFDIVMLG